MSDITVYNAFDNFIQEVVLNENENKIFTCEKGEEKSQITPKLDKLQEIFIKHSMDKTKDKNGKEIKTFDDKIKIQLKDLKENKENTLLALAYVEWLWKLPSSNMKNKTPNIMDLKSIGIENDFKIEFNSKYNNLGGIGGSGQFHNQNKYHEITFLAYLMSYLKTKFNEKNNKSEEDIKEEIESICLDIIEPKIKETNTSEDKREEQDKRCNDFELNEKIKPSTMPHALLNLCFPYEKNDSYSDNEGQTKYLPIFSNSHKNKISNTFNFLLGDMDDEYSQKNLCEITHELFELVDSNKIETTNHLYYYKKKSNVAKILEFKDSTATYDEVEALKFKKNIVLYGPPGTSKTFSAEQIFESLILREQIRDAKGDNAKLKEIISSNNQIYSDKETQIITLQLHQNYTYDDFIYGQTIKDKNVEPVEGEFVKYIKEINNANEKNNETKYLLILDEINRADLSAVFGEAFSAIEKRDQPITLKKGEPITVPHNLYIIGTMNEIDFSLERMDFALRRRFAWFEYNFDETLLNEILNFELEKEEYKKPKDKLSLMQEDYIESAKILNEMVKKEEELGSTYQIGHVMFAEIVELFKHVYNIKSSAYAKTILKEAKEILWDMSLKPMLSAYLGNLPQTDKDDKLKELRKYFMGK